MNQLRRLWRFLPRDQVLVRKSEDLRDRPGETLGEILSFLDVDDLADVPPRRVRSGSYDREMTRRERRYLQRTFENEIRELECMLGWD